MLYSYECVIRSTSGAEIGRELPVLAGDAPLSDVRRCALDMIEGRMAEAGAPLDINDVASIDVRSGIVVTHSSAAGSIERS